MLKTKVLCFVMCVLDIFTQNCALPDGLQAAPTDSAPHLHLSIVLGRCDEKPPKGLTPAHTQNQQKTQ